MDIVGVTFIACVTGVGGGTMRDILLGATPVEWVQEPTVIIVCIAGALAAAMFNGYITGKRLGALLWMDAIGLAVFAVLGCSKAITLGAHPFVAILFGAMSATFGGIIRDVICNEVPVLFRKEIYITAALFGSVLFILLPDGWNQTLNASIAISCCFALRGLAMKNAWSLPRINK